MPNHVTNRLTLTGAAAEIAAFLEKHLSDPDENGVRQLDFNSIIPMPDELKDAESSSRVRDGLFALTGEKQMFSPLELPHIKAMGITTQKAFREYLETYQPEALELARKAMKLREETGHTSWYSWSIANWGTKWNAYRTQIETGAESTTIVFRTAWSVAEPVLLAFSAAWPTLTFSIIAFDEGWNFAYDAEIQNGAIARGGRTDATNDLHEKVYGFRIEENDDSDPRPTLH